MKTAEELLKKAVIAMNQIDTFLGGHEQLRGLIDEIEEFFTVPKEDLDRWKKELEVMRPPQLMMIRPNVSEAVKLLIDQQMRKYRDSS
jgi:hypothetical protein